MHYICEIHQVLRFSDVFWGTAGCCLSPLFCAINSNVSPFRTVYGLTLKAAVIALETVQRGWQTLSASCMQGTWNSDPAADIHLTYF